MLDNRVISNKHNNPNNDRSKDDLKKRSLDIYEDDTFFDLVGYGKLIYHPEKLVGIKNETNPFPITATVSLGNFCNHGCLWCSTAYFREDDAFAIDGDKLINWVTKAKDKGLRGVGYVGNGEPLAFKKFKIISKKINDLDIDQGIFTNGYLIDRYEEELLQFAYVRISLDAGTAETHSKLHAVKENHFPKIIQNVEKLIKNKKDNFPTVGFQFATHQDNIEELELAVKIARDIGVNYLSVKPVFDRGTVKDKIARNSLTKKDFDEAVGNLSKYRDETFKIFYRPQQIISESMEQNQLVYNRCYAPYLGVNIYEDGGIVGCGPHHVEVGNLDTPLDELEKNIIKASKSFDLVKCPAGCRYHAANYLVNQVIEPTKIKKTKHINML